MTHRPRVRLVEQGDHSECGLATAAMILGYGGFDTTLNDLRDVFGVPRGGNSFSHLQSVLGAYGVGARGVRVSNTSFFKKMPVPVICHWQGTHFVVVDRYRRGRFRVLDPAEGKIKMKEDRFWSSFTGFTLIPEVKASESPVRRSWRKTLSLTSSTYVQAGVILFLTFLFQLLSLGVTLWTKQLIDATSGVVENLSLTWILGMIICVAVLYYVVQTSRLLFLTKFQISFERTVMSNFMARISEFALKYFVNRGSGDLIFRANLSSVIQQILSQRVLLAFVEILFAAIYVLAMFLLSSTLAWFVLGASLVMIILSIMYSIRYRELVSEQMSREIQTQETLVEFFEGMETIKSLGHEQFFVERWRQKFLAKQDVDKRQGRLTAFLQTSFNAINFVMPVAVLAVGLHEYSEGRVTIGTVVSFVAIAGAFLTPVLTLLESYSQILVVGSYLNKIGEVVDYEPPMQVEGASRWPRRFRSVVVQDVSFAYSVFDPPVISHIDLEIRAGEKIAIVGPSGSGKSTLLKVITGLDQPTAGVVTVDGIDIQYLDRKSLTTAVSYGNQESAVFNATIRENILAGASTSDDLAELVTGVGLDSVVRSSPLGMETMISARGANLSGGQKQRLVLARALARDPQIVILDEPTSALDNESEAQVMSFLQTRVETCVVVAHRLATIRNFDRIIVLNNGAVVETGTHDQLMSQNGIYYDLYSNSQDTSERLMGVFAVDEANCKRA